MGVVNFVYGLVFYYYFFFKRGFLLCDFIGFVKLKLNKIICSLVYFYLVFLKKIKILFWFGLDFRL